MIPIIFEECQINSKLSQVLKYSNVIIWGAARGGRKAIELIEENLDHQKLFVVDNDINKIGKTFFGIRVESKQLLKELPPEKSIIAITCANYESIVDSLDEEWRKRYIILDVAWADEKYVDLVNKNMHLFENAYGFLSDGLSRDTFCGVINYRISNNDVHLKNIVRPNSSIYFDDLLTPYKISYYVDGGAYNGDTIKRFAEYTNNQFEKIYAFEPNPLNVRKMDSGIVNDRRIEIFECALDATDKRARLDISTYNGASSGFVSLAGEVEIECVSLDRLLGKTKIDYIKLDVEGGEMNALIGARGIIGEQHPILAVCAYHRPQDLYELPDLIKRLYGGYHLYFRHYSNTAFETVLYAMP